MDILIKALQLILSFSILIITHEFGHFITAKLFKTRVDKFYLFFKLCNQPFCHFSDIFIDGLKRFLCLLFYGRIHILFHCIFLYQLRFFYICFKTLTVIIVFPDCNHFYDISQNRNL